MGLGLRSTAWYPLLHTDLQYVLTWCFAQAGGSTSDVTPCDWLQAAAALTQHVPNNAAESDVRAPCSEVLLGTAVST
jgi:hypothetical protein